MLRWEDVGLRVQDLEHPLAGGQGPLTLVYDHPEALHRPDELHEVELEEGELADGEGTLYHGPAAEEYEDGDGGCGQEAHPRYVERSQAPGGQSLVQDTLGPVPEAVRLEGFAGEALHDPDTGDVLLNDRRYVGELLLDGAEYRVNLTREPPRREREERHRAQDHRRQRRVQVQRRPRDNDEREQ